MHHRHELSISASMAAISTELARPESRHESPSAAGAFDTAVTVCGVRSDELVRVAAEVDAGFADEIEEGEFVVLLSLESVDVLVGLECKCGGKTHHLGHRRRFRSRVA